MIISSKVMEDVMKVVKSLEESDILIKSASETINDKLQEQTGGFLGM